MSGRERDCTDLHPFANPGRTKLALVSRGVALPDGLPEASRFIAQANAIESVIDLRLPGGQFVTAPVGLPFTESSGFALRVREDGAWLECGGERQRVTLIEAPRFYRQTTRGGARMGSFAALHDRLLILHPWLGCGFFAAGGREAGLACRYCQYDSMLNADAPPLRDPLELVEVVRAALAEREVDTVYLYNGFSPGEDCGLSRLVPVIALLRKHLGSRQIALETVAPADVTVIDELYAAGLDVFVCNLEVADEARFAGLCPGKQAHGGQAAVWRALDRARRVFRAGSVVSHLIVGLEPLESTIAGMKALIGRGVVPLLVPFRPLPGTPLADHPPPSLDDVEQALLVQYELLAESSLPTHRLRDMGRVLTPMESRALIGGETTLAERMAGHALGRKVHGWLDGFRRMLRRREGDDGEPAMLDQRPILHLLGERAAPFVALAALAVAFAGLAQAAPPAGLDARGWHALLVFGLCLALWVTQLLPLPVTSILGLSLLPALGVMPSAEAYAMFGNPAVFFILGAFVLAAGVMRTGLAEHLALWVFDRAGPSGLRLLLAMLLLPAGMACFMPEHAVVAVLLPLVAAVARGMGLVRGDRFATALFLALAWGAVIGGVTTLLGGARGPLALAILEQSAGASFGFAQWTLAALPVVVPMLALAAWMLMRISDWRGADMAGARARIEARRLELGRLDGRGRMMAALMLATVAAWLLAGEALDLAAISLLAVVAMFALRIARWRDVQAHVDWGVVLMYGGAIAVASALEASGAGAWLAERIWPDGLSPWGMLMLLALGTMLLTESISNSAAVAIMLPLALPVAARAGVDPVTVAIAVGIVSGFAFMLPMGTPANAMVLGSGHVRLAQMLRFGLALMLAALLVFGIVSRWVWPATNGW
ncbi:MAG: DASS family sodium-coupled anion symporter [Mariprofundaceae bacterium]